MFNGIWLGKNIPTDNRILILGESHYGDHTNLVTADVVEKHITPDMFRYPFFSRISQTFGYYGQEEEKIFYEKVCFGNYSEKCFRERNSNEKKIVFAQKRDEYNSNLFAFVNEYQIETIVVFSKLSYENLPPFASDEEREEVFCLSNARGNTIRKCNYLAGIVHEHSVVELEKSINVWAINHPTGRWGYKPKLVYECLRSDSSILWLFK